MSDERTRLYDAVKADPRYPVEAYEFLCQGLAHTQQLLGREPDPEDGDDPAAMADKHVSGQELCEGLRLYALEQYGQMAYILLKCWNVRATDDFGAMVYHLIGQGVWFGSERDRQEDFHAVYDFERAFVHDYKITWEDA